MCRPALKATSNSAGSPTANSTYAAANRASCSGYFHWALSVDDLDATFTHLLDAGATEVSAPAPAARAGARFAYVKDPEGNLLELIQPS
ncbi:VOC family protein [Kribbella sp. NPDC000426]|uniref:VOC family protein n=1 Tax=Kribbella sp. NPDC000426 TaxID=3154255 RepID=UPI003329ED85